MKSKSIIISMVLGLSAGNAIFANHFLNNGGTPSTIVAEGEVIANHSVEFTAFPYTRVIRENGGDWASQYLPFHLTDPKNYACIMQDFGSLRSKFNTDGHLFIGTIGQCNRFNIRVDPLDDDRHIFENEEEYAKNNPINVLGFNDLKGVDFYMGEGNEVTLKVSKYDEDIVALSYNPETKVNSFRITNSSRFVEWGFEYDGAADGQKLVIDKVVLYYNCPRIG